MWLQPVQVLDRITRKLKISLNYKRLAFIGWKSYENCIYDSKCMIIFVRQANFPKFYGHIGKILISVKYTDVRKAKSMVFKSYYMVILTYQVSRNTKSACCNKVIHFAGCFRTVQIFSDDECECSRYTKFTLGIAWKWTFSSSFNKVRRSQNKCFPSSRYANLADLTRDSGEYIFGDLITACLKYLRKEKNVSHAEERFRVTKNKEATTYSSVSKCLPIAFLQRMWKLVYVEGTLQSEQIARKKHVIQQKSET